MFTFHVPTWFLPLAERSRRTRFVALSEHFGELDLPFVLFRLRYELELLFVLFRLRYRFTVNLSLWLLLTIGNSEPVRCQLSRAATNGNGLASLYNWHTKALSCLLSREAKGTGHVLLFNCCRQILPKFKLCIS